MMATYPFLPPATQFGFAAALLLAAAAVGAPAMGQDHEKGIEKGVERAVAYLAAETPRWRMEHRCASCHHQGAAVRALLAARAKGWLPSDAPLENSLEWLAAPAGWKENHGDPLASDQTLAELQFGGSLLVSSRLFPERMKPPLGELAKMLAARQGEKGQFELEASEGLPSPITLGPILLTGVARRVFEEQGEHFAPQARRAREWLASQSPRNPLEASSLILALEGVAAGQEDSAGSGKEGGGIGEARRAARKRLLEAAHPDGGFGPYASAPAEVFDTALAILALARDSEAAQHAELVERARAKLLTWQLEEGGFAETTRPSGGVSYAHRVATTAWALEALLEGTKGKQRTGD